MITEGVRTKLVVSEFVITKYVSTKAVITKSNLNKNSSKIVVINAVRIKKLHL